MKNIYQLGLRIALRFSNFLYKLISFLAIKSENGLHPKHRLMEYHQFFLDNISNTDTVLDIGCGNGSLAYDVSGKARKVVAVDIEEGKIAEARRKYSRQNIDYRVADATQELGSETFDIVILSNVLEHIEHRVEFLKSIKNLAPKFLIRVPMFDRDWIPLLKKELGIEWRLDLTHFTEFTMQSFRRELMDSGFEIKNSSVQFGEIWAVVVPK